MAFDSENGTEVKRELKATIKASTNNNGYKKLKDARISPRPQSQPNERDPPD